VTTPCAQTTEWCALPEPRQSPAPPEPEPEPASAEQPPPEIAEIRSKIREVAAAKIMREHAERTNATETELMEWGRKTLREFPGAQKKGYQAYQMMRLLLAVWQRPGTILRP
jgi:hypothetical protein